MFDQQLLDRRPTQDETFDEVTGRVLRQPRDVSCVGTVPNVGVNDGPDEAGAFGPGCRTPA
jgi:hypothetical protein